MYYRKTKKWLMALVILLSIISGWSLLYILQTEKKQNMDGLKLAKHRVVVMSDNHNTTIDTHAETVGEVLTQLNIRLGDQDIVEPAAMAKLNSNTLIRVTRLTSSQNEFEEEIPYTTVKYDDPDLFVGKEKVIQQGIPGKELISRTLVLENGQVSSELELSRKVISPYTPEVIAVGSRVPVPKVEYQYNEAIEHTAVSEKKLVKKSHENSIVSEGDKKKMINIEERPVEYKFILEDVELTAFTAGVESTGKDQGHPEYGITASGTTVEEGRTIAVDPSVIPMGWWVYIEGVGYRKAEDTGSAVNGKIIDVFIEDLDSAILFGRQKNKRVYVIGPDDPQQ
ncbi:G5 domain-containing protein [Paenibacillus illinoisensis]|uniref:G5 domain-containing protein n=1 Tax=Paenibacillus illinoisensis TaxID=59845 RepID=UPI001C8E019D|nr:3D domain-containing protein [Paenibacillus illinoisensis]MBY0217760.1 G5 domain-containing protein [Paenibacillus illinoisensis]